MEVTGSQNSNFNEYKKEVSVYREYTEKIVELTKQKRKYKYSSCGLSIILGPIISFYIIAFLAEYIGENLALYLFLTTILFFIAGIESIFQSDSFANIISSGKLDKVKNELDQLELLRTDSLKKIEPIEQIISEYFETYLDDYYKNNLYRKRSGNKQFEESLAEFYSMVEDAKKVDLVTIRLDLNEYENYISRRVNDHNFQISKNIETDNFIRNLSKNLSNTQTRKTKEFIAPEKSYRTARKIDNWDDINKKRKITGLEGEEIVVVLEQEFLESIGRNDLSQKVRHVSAEDGDGLGYDVLSFFENEEEKYIEVKSTTTSLSSPFYLSRNELEFLKEHTENAFIYRVFISEDEEPQIKIESSIEFLEKNDLIPIQYMVKAK